MHLKVGNMWLWLNEPFGTNFYELHPLDEMVLYGFINNYLNHQPLNSLFTIFLSTCVNT